MDPQFKSILTTTAAVIAGSIAAWAAHNGLIPSADQSVVANDLVTFVFAGAAILITRYKAQAHTPTAQIAAVNTADNGVKVVAITATAPVVTVPLK
jgi:hypothetical protein